MSGKIPPNLLRKYVFSRIGAADPAVIVGPTYGEDSAIIDLGDNVVLVVHVDPITAAEENIGWLAVHIACNDVAVCGAKPRWLLSTILLPENAPEELLDKITRQIDAAAKEVGAMVVGGHSEYTPHLARPIVVMSAIGLAPRDRYVTTSGVKPGDYIIMTKAVALEGTSILATDFEETLLSRGVSKVVIERARQFIREISVVKEALTLAKVGVHSMHDPTEGGILCGLAEMAYSSRVLIEVWEERVPIREETRVVCQVLGLDPLKLISSGVLLAAVPPENLDRALTALKEVGVGATVIGVAREGCGVKVHRVTGVVEEVNEYIRDEIYKLWEKE
ncbi:MAG: hydrogenase assembly protein HupF [Thermoprotei archaeon]|nr:MAG: hydrogenase assembly protein HupF [Thermoprotei archaeon]